MDNPKNLELGQLIAYYFQEKDDSEKMYVRIAKVVKIPKYTTRNIFKKDFWVPTQHVIKAVSFVPRVKMIDWENIVHWHYIDEYDIAWKKLETKQ